MTLDTDNFEFKPLSEGLGFHKKVIDIKETHKEEVVLPPTSLISANPDERIFPEKSKPSWTPQISNIGFKDTFSKVRAATTPQSAHKVGSNQRNVNSSAQNKSKSLLIDKGTNVAHGVDIHPAISIPLKKVLVSWPASLFDGTMVLGMALLFSAIVFAVTRIDVGQLSELLGEEGAAQIAAMVLTLAVFELYAVGCRSFFGKTLGEWVFDLRLGTREEQSQMSYPIKVAWRTLLVSLTGFVLLPLISLITKKDILKILTGLEINQEQR